MEDSQNSLDQLKKYTIIVADTGDINLIKKLNPKDATTNPSLLVKASEQPEYFHLIDKAIAYGCSKVESINQKEMVSLILDKMFVYFGIEILQVIEGYVSTEIDARLSFDVDASLERARRMIKLYEEEGISRDRILVKLAATWEGIKAAEILEKEGIRCNLTLVFSLAQAIACAEAGVTLISPFVGRINDGYSTKYGKTFKPSEEPGVILVKNIFDYYTKFGYKTIIMAASLRTAESVLELAGCERITMPPTVIEKLKQLNTPVQLKLDSSNINNDVKKVEMDEKTFRWMMNEDEIGNEKLADGIRIFARDAVKLENFIKSKLLNNK